jgi:uncharacterized membrane protein
MYILLDNLTWMPLNELLAVLPVIFVWFSFRAQNKVLKILFGMLWILFLPNSIYIITDMQHLIRQWFQVDVTEKLILLVQYSVLESIGIMAFFLSLHPFEDLLKRWKYTKNSAIPLLVSFNFVMGFAMVLGKVERIHSWYLFTQPMRALHGILHMLGSMELIALALLLGAFTNCFYFLFRDLILKRLSKTEYVKSIHSS